MKPGDTFLGGGEVHGSHHLWVVVNNPAAHGGEAVIVNVSTQRPGAETTCVLSEGEHPFIQHQSYVRYQSARKVGVPALQAAVKAGLLKPRAAVNAALLAKIKAGAQASPLLPLELRALL